MQDHVRNIIVAFDIFITSTYMYLVIGAHVCWQCFMPHFTDHVITYTFWDEIHVDKKPPGLKEFGIKMMLNFRISFYALKQAS